MTPTRCPSCGQPLDQHAPSCTWRTDNLYMGVDHGLGIDYTVYSCSCGYNTTDLEQIKAHTCADYDRGYLYGLRSRIERDREAGPAPIPETQEYGIILPLGWAERVRLILAIRGAKTLDDLLGDA